MLLTAHNGGDESALTELVDLYEAWGKPEKAAEYRALLRRVEKAKASE